MPLKNFFTQNYLTLKQKRFDVIKLLEIKGYSEVQIEVYLKAYDYFTFYPKDYDGATIVKDLCDLPRLDLDAMLHDYQFVKYNVAKSFYYKHLSNWIYAKGQERKGKGSYSSFTRFLGLCVLGIFFVPYTYIKKRNKKIDLEIINDYKKLIK